ncbi:MAG: hypothetical protein GWO41_08970, partial [candidate division Zixibacteria bacterium]|nr:hypothetical protein [candidate division Zixibacteria bacterium]NIW39752.1 hypothetical protein [candidate division Zixibacteria bacterium]NIX55063.1 hypothetical protein [candidate division Zixibacteria bacterium]
MALEMFGSVLEDGEFREIALVLLVETHTEAGRFAEAGRAIRRFRSHSVDSTAMAGVLAGIFKNLGQKGVTVPEKYLESWLVHDILSDLGGRERYEEALVLAGLAQGIFTGSVRLENAKADLYNKQGR